LIRVTNIQTLSILLRLMNDYLSRQAATQLINKLILHIITEAIRSLYDVWSIKNAEENVQVYNFVLSATGGTNPYYEFS